ncbi:MAG TPA: glutamate--tRNA ligase [Thermoplasmata archaeon]|nr:glutamate--tRNA ligase [Thermoplasmata archaeon]
MDLQDEIKYHLLRNAVRHGGRAMPKAILGAILGAHPEMRREARHVLEIAGRLADEINAMAPEEQESALRAYGIVEERTAERGLPSLRDAQGNEWEGEVVMRFAPGPSGPLHIGHTRALVLNDEYVRRYGGRLILRIEDTNPANILEDAYDMIREDVEWLGVAVHEVAIQSDRIDIYYDHVRELLDMGAAYVCTCPVEEWRTLKLERRACPHREGAGDLDRWARMLDGTYAQGEASLVVKTDLDHLNPAARDFVAMRIVETPHPRTGDRYRVYPTYNFAVAIDDHLMGMTHILRGKDHLNNTLRQQYVYRHLGWDEPVFIHYGWVRIEGVVLKTSTIKEAIARGEFTGWDDVRLGTLRAMRARGIRPEAIRETWVEVGAKEVDIVFSWENLYSHNRKLVDDLAPRFFFAPDPVRLDIHTGGPLRMSAPIQPDHPERGAREYLLEPENGVVWVHVPGDDLPPEGLIRLKDLCNVDLRPDSEGGARSPPDPARPDGLEVVGASMVRSAEYAGNDLSVLKEGVRIIQAVPDPGALPCTVRMPDGSCIEGLVERGIERIEPMTVAQFERFGFVNVVSVGDHVLCNFAHR